MWPGCKILKQTNKQIAELKSWLFSAVLNIISVTLTTVPFSCDSSKACWEVGGSGGVGLGPSWAWRQQKRVLKMLQLWGCFREERLTWPVQPKKETPSWETPTRKCSMKSCIRSHNGNQLHVSCISLFMTNNYLDSYFMYFFPFTVCLCKDFV